MEIVWAVTRAIMDAHGSYSGKRKDLAVESIARNCGRNASVGQRPGPSKVETMPCSAIGPAAANPKIIHPSPFRCFVLRNPPSNIRYRTFGPLPSRVACSSKAPREKSSIESVRTVFCLVYSDAQLRELDHGSRDALPRLGLQPISPIDHSAAQKFRGLKFSFATL